MGSVHNRPKSGHKPLERGSACSKKKAAHKPKRKPDTTRKIEIAKKNNLTITLKPTPVTVDPVISVAPTPVTVEPVIRVEPAPVTVEPAITVSPAPVTIEPAITVSPAPITVEPAPVTVTPVIVPTPFRRVCTTIRETQQLTNPQLIMIPGPGMTSIATPYPSSIVVSGMTGTIVKVTATLLDFSSQNSADLDLMLVGPDGATNTILMSDAGTLPVGGLTLSFDDDAPNLLPAAGAIVSGTYKPTNYAGIENDTFPPPAPPVSPISMMSNFFGQNPNGTWSLYGTDDTPGNASQIRDGWILRITTEREECLYTPV
ncbi:hypothetical protein [Paenibacillus flagellatus]|uniref:P/Homo B domain-containing protein n=1 Tax=Paenibacillus flagellatus TaxID=2211139 RepID=A0A2V5KP97_9BACL|nr:hypothetical protein [Paenibacillus flagellatus]PYI50296.1 hypothetical protein DLM86_29955 [Paenibacillus flagellatus]